MKQVEKLDKKSFVEKKLEIESDEVLTNFMEIKVLEGNELKPNIVHVYEIIFGTEKNYQKKAIIKKIKIILKPYRDNQEDGEKFFLVSNNLIISKRKIEELNKVFKVKIRYDEHNVKFLHKEYDFSINNFEKIGIESVNKNISEKERILNEVLHGSLLLEENILKTFYVNPFGRKDDRYQHKKLLDSTENLPKKHIEDYFLIKNVFKSFSITISCREKGFFLVTNPSTKQRWEYPNGLDLIKGFRDFGHSDEEISEYFSKFSIKNLTYNMGSRILEKITRIRFDMTPLSKINFVPRGMEDVKTFKEYFFRKYKLDRLKDTFDDKQPFFEIERWKKSRESGKLEKSKEYYLPQLTTIDCHLEKEHYFKSKWVGKKTFMTSKERYEGIKYFLDILSKTKNVVSNFRKLGFNLNFGGELEKVKYSTVQNVVIESVFGDQTHDVKEGCNWHREFKKTKLKSEVNGKKIEFKRLVLLYTREFKVEAEKLLEDVLWCAKYRGIESQDLKTVDRLEVHPEENYMDKVHKIRPKILLAIIDSESMYNYAVEYAIKTGTIVQCARGNTLREKMKIMNLLSNNIMMQVFAKAGGNLWNVKLCPFFFENKNTIVIGIDACRDTKMLYQSVHSHGFFQRKKYSNYPSNYAVVAVCPNKNWTRRMVFLLRGRRQEISKLSLKRAVKFFIAEFQNEFKKRVDNIIIYRDGVSDHQTKDVKERELSGVISVIKEFTPTTKLAFLVIQKGVKALFFDTDFQNPLAGSIINKMITFNESFLKSFYLHTDFYLQSQQSSASRPCHYILVHNDFKSESIDKLEQLTFEVCNLYWNYPGTIKTPYVAQLAHCLSNKLYRSIFYLDGDDKEGYYLCLKVNFYSFAEEKIKDGYDFEEDESEEVQIVCHPEFNNKFVEL